MNNDNKWLLPDGVDELLPEAAERLEHLRRRTLDLFKSWGYQQVVPSLVEFTESLLLGASQDLVKQSVFLTDQVSGRKMAVRADITPQVARIDAHRIANNGVNRLCYVGTVLHTSTDQLHGSRTPIVAGAELYGNSGMEADIEVISLMLETIYASLATDDKHSAQTLTLDMGHVSIYDGLVDAIDRANPHVPVVLRDKCIEAIKRKSTPDLADIVPQLEVPENLQQSLMQLPSLCGSASDLKGSEKVLATLGEEQLAAANELFSIADVLSKRFPELNIYFDFTEQRGYEYHTGVVFAAYVAGTGVALANGGRYNQIGEVFGAGRSATGFSLDLKTLLKIAPGTAVEDGQIACVESDDIAQWQFVCDLRRQGKTIVYVDEESSRQYSRQLKLVDGSWAVH